MVFMLKLNCRPIPRRKEPSVSLEDKFITDSVARRNKAIKEIQERLDDGTTPVEVEEAPPAETTEETPS